MRISRSQTTDSEMGDIVGQNILRRVICLHNSESCVSGTYQRRAPHPTLMLGTS